MNRPSALMLLAPGCAHCPGVLDALARLLKEGVIGRLEAVNVAVHPEAAEELKVRTVPWVRMGEFELSGARTIEELRRLAGASAALGERSGDAPAPLMEHLVQMLAEGALARVEALLKDAPQHLAPLVQRIADPELPLQARIGIGALAEEFAATAALAEALPALVGLAAHPESRVRADACHFLGLTAREEARAPLHHCLADPDPEVREIAEEALEALSRSR